MEVPGFCTLCRSRCGTLNIVEDGRLVEVRPLPGHPTGKALCPKGRAAPEIVHSARRLQTPMRRTRPKTDDDPGWEAIGWDEALDTIAERLHAISQGSGPEAVAFSFTSPSASSISDSLPWLERFAWTFGSPNICWSTELCNWHKDHAHEFTVGTGMPVPDYRNTDLIVLWGHNPANAWLAQSEAIGQGRQQGARLAVIDPRKTSLATGAELWLRVRPGSDGVLALAVAKLLIESGRFDDAFVRRWTNAPLLVREDNGRLLRASEIGLGNEALFVVWDAQARAPRAYVLPDGLSDEEAARTSLTGRFSLGVPGEPIHCRPAFALYRESLQRYDPAAAAVMTGVPEEGIRALADEIAAAGRVCYYGWTGIGQHGDATQTDRAIAVLFALKGQYDAPGGNVLWPEQAVKPISSYSMLPPGQRAKALGLQERPVGPAARGWVTGSDLYRAITLKSPYPIRALLGFGANLLVSQPNPVLGKQALEQLEFYVHCDLFESPTAAKADILLPVNSAWEREGLRAGFEIGHEAQEHVQLRRQIVPAQGEGRSEMWIASELAKRLGFGAAFYDGDFDAAWNDILAPAGLTTAELREHPEGMRVPLVHGFHKYAQRGASGVRGFDTETRRVEIYSERLLRHGYPPLPAPGPAPATSQEFPVVLTTAKNGYFCHSQHRGIASLRRRSPMPRVDISPALAGQRGIAPGDAVVIRSAHGSVSMQARIDPDLDSFTAVAEYGWWQAAPDLGLPGFAPSGPTTANYNALLTDAGADPVSGAPDVRSLVCDVQRSASFTAAWTGFRPLVVVSHRQECDGVVTVHVAAPGGEELPPLAPGQFLTVATDRAAADAGVVRSYSCINAAVAQPREYAIAIKRCNGGLVSPHLADRLAVGTTLLAQSPAGSFLLPRFNEFPVVLVAAGIGITPFMSYLETLALQEQQPEVWLYYGTSSSRTHAFKRRIAQLREALPHLKVFTCYSRPQAGDRIGVDFDRAGRVVPDLFDASLLRRRARFYLCGPDDMMRSTVADLVRAGVHRFEIFQERFVSPRLARAAAGAESHSIHFARSGSRLRWTPESGSILNLALAHGVQIPTGCRVGQCESCLVPVLEGHVLHSSACDEVPERHCLSCQAIPQTDLVIDA